MNLGYINNFVTKDLAINIDISNTNSWDLNTGLTISSISKWNNAISDNLDLIDFGLTEFDVGRIDKMWSGTTYQPSDIYFNMYRMGYNDIANPTTGYTSGVTVTTNYLSMSANTTDSVGNYFELDGGYLQGFFKLEDYNYELLPSRFNNGITVETLVYLYPNSNGIFYYMGTRAEDKYNPLFSGETVTAQTYNNIIVTSGVTTSENNFLDSLISTTVNSISFRNYETEHLTTINVQESQSANTTSNVISFEITNDYKLGYKYIDENNNIAYNKAQNIIPSSGWTLLSISYVPNNIITDLSTLKCSNRRTGTLSFFINGRLNWEIKDFPEFYFKGLQNNKEKQIGVPYNISWGGGSFGLEHSWHYDSQSYNLYDNYDTTYINTNYIVESSPIDNPCNPYPVGTILNDLSLSANSTTFYNVDSCNPSIEYPISVMSISCVENPIISGSTGYTYYVKYTKPINVLSNRDYTVTIPIIDDGFFIGFKPDGTQVHNKLSIYIEGNVEIVSDSQYMYPLTEEDILALEKATNSTPFKEEYEYVGTDGITYYGATGEPVYTTPDYYTFFNIEFPRIVLNSTKIYTGQNIEIPLQTVFHTPSKSGEQEVYIGLLFETDYEFNLHAPVFAKTISYNGEDILVQDANKNNLLIEQNFNSSFNGKLQKLRVYNRGLKSNEILQNAYIESLNSNLNIQVTKGGRIIYR